MIVPVYDRRADSLLNVELHVNTNGLLELTSPPRPPIPMMIMNKPRVVYFEKEDVPHLVLEMDQKRRALS